MATFSEALGAECEPMTVVIGNKKYKMGKFVQATKADLEKWIYTKEIESISLTKEFVSEKEYAESFRRLAKERAAGRFAWGSKRMLLAVTGLNGIAKCISLMCTDEQGNHPDPNIVEDDLVDPEKNELIMAVFNASFQESLPGIQKKMNQTKGESKETTPPQEAAPKRKRKWAR